MGASSSRLEEDKALQLCRERKKFVRQALDGRCSLAATHVTYIQSLKITGTALRRFFEPEAPTESSLYTSTSATPEPLGLTEKSPSPSQFSFSSPSISQRVDATENFSPSPSPPVSSRYQTNHMKFRGSFSRKVEEKPYIPVVGSVTSSSTPKNTTPRSIDRSEPSMSPFNAPPIPPDAPAWDYFGPSHPIDSHFSSQDGKELNHRYESSDYIRRFREAEGIPDLEDEEEKVSFRQREDFHESEDEFDEPSTDTLVRSFDNVNRATDHAAASASPAMPSAESVASETEFLDREKSYSPYLSPLRSSSSGVGFANDVKTTVTPLRSTSAGVGFANDAKTTVAQEDGIENKVPPKDLFSSMKDIEALFAKASESGIEVPRMLEANKFHFRPIFPGKERGSLSSTLLKSCFSCGDDPSQVQEEPAETTTKYLTWHRTTSSRSSSSRNLPGVDTKDDIEDLTTNLFDNFCMNAGSHASTLDRLYAWERKLYDEVKASEMVRKVYDQKCRLLRQLESQGESSHKIDKIRAVVKDLHSRIRVAIHRIDSISKKIEDLRDQELQPQLEELIEGLRKMWEQMFKCHKLQFHIISSAYYSNTKISFQSDSHRQITIHLENELHTLSSSFKNWIAAQKTYVEAINSWLFKCVSLEQKSSKRKRRMQPPPLRNLGPPIYVTCGDWLDMLKTLPVKEVSDSIKGLAAEISHLLPRQEKNQVKGTNHHSTAWQGQHSNSDMGANLLGQEEVSENWLTGFDRVRSSLVGFLGQLNNFAGSSVKMYADLQKSIQDAKRSYAHTNSSRNAHS